MPTYNVSVSLMGTAAVDLSGVFNVKASPWNATADGVTDDYAAIQTCIDAAELAGNGSQVRIPTGTYYLGTGLTVENSVQFDTIEVDARGAEFKFAQDINGPLIRLGGASDRHFGIIWTGGKVWFGDTSTEDWDNTAGFQIFNGSECRLRDVTVYGCKDGIQLYAESGQGVSYNTVEPIDIINCETGIDFYHENAGGWNTENTVIGGKIDYTSGLVGTDCSGGAAIRIRGVTGSGCDHSEQHKFYGTSCEVNSGIAAPPALIDMEGRYHLFSGIRTENFGTGDITIQATSGDSVGSYGNYFMGGRALNWSSLIDSGDLKYAQVIGGREVRFTGAATSSLPLLTAEYSGVSSNIPLIRAVDSAGATAFDVWDTGYVILKSIPTASITGSPVTGMIIYDSTANKLKFYNGSAWETVTSA